jgi:hypothetical protein
MNKITQSGYQYMAFMKALAFFGEKTICVFRDFEGKPAILRLDNQSSFREWNGCFSLYNFDAKR